MPFTSSQIRLLKAPIKRQHVKEREVEGKTLHYVEGWHVVAEANRIFGFDAWDRETISSQCIWQKNVDHRFVASYLARVRICVRAGGAVVVREGIGLAEATAATPGQAHERAAKGAETDATKRALCTFGNSFGLSLYGNKCEPPRRRTRAPLKADAAAPMIPAETAVSPVAYLPVVLPPEQHTAPLGRIDKSELTHSEPKRLRSREHLRFVASRPCLACGRIPSQAHHLRFAQPRAMGRKVSDEYTVPLCAIHHHDLHMRGSEKDWWSEKSIDPMPVAEELWAMSRQGSANAAE
jgi:hypothetical protein